MEKGLKTNFHPLGQQYPVLRRKNGVALVYAVIVLLVVSILTSAILLTFSANLNQINRQKNYSEAYYLAYSGVQMAFAALIANDDTGVPNDLFNQFVNGTISHLSQDDIVYGNGVIDISVDMIDDNASNFDGWIMIQSTATLSQGGFTLTRIFYVDPYDQKNTAWQDG